MDTGHGTFKPLNLVELLEAQKKEQSIFRVGEEVELNGSRFRVRKITRKDLVLRLLPRK